MKMFGWLAITASVCSQSAFADNSKFDVASVCADVATYVDNIAAITAATSNENQVFAQADLNRAAAKYRPTLQLFQIVSGQAAREFAFKDADGVRGIVKLANSCVAKSNCDERVTEVIAGFSYFLIEACTKDFEVS